MEGLRLYEIDRAITSVINLGFVVDEETGEILFDADNLEALEAAREAKLEGCAVFVKSLEAEAAALKAEETALAERRKAKEARAERIRAYMANSMLAAGETKLETARCALSFRKSEAVELDETLLSEEWFAIKKAPDKAGIKKALKSGIHIAGAQLVTRQNLQVK